MGLDSVELVMAWEDAFAMDIPDADALTLSTVGDVVNYFEARLTAAGRPLPRAEVFAMVGRLTCEQLGTKPHQLTEATSFVNDLGMD